MKPTGHEKRRWQRKRKKGGGKSDDHDLIIPWSF